MVDLPGRFDHANDQTGMRLASVAFLSSIVLIRTSAALAQDPGQRAWEILEEGHNSQKARERANSAHALGQLKGNLHAIDLAEQAITDKQSEVRAAAAIALGNLGSRHSIPLLKRALEDKSVQVNFAASSALLSLGDPSGYSIYYEVLIGERKTGEGAVVEEKRLVRDPKAMALMGMGVAMGFAPYAGYGWAFYEVLSKDYGGPVRLDAVQKLGNDPDPQVEAALVKAASDKNTKVRVAALEAIGSRGDPHLLDMVVRHLSDRDQLARCTAAAAVILLSAGKKVEVR